MLLKYEVQSSKWQKNAGEVDTVKITKRLSSILRTLGFFLYIVVGHSDGSWINKWHGQILHVR